MDRIIIAVMSLVWGIWALGRAVLTRPGSFRAKDRLVGILLAAAACGLAAVFLRPSPGPSVVPSLAYVGLGGAIVGGIILAVRAKPSAERPASPATNLSPWRAATVLALTGAAATAIIAAYLVPAAWLGSPSSPLIPVLTMLVAGFGVLGIFRLGLASRGEAPTKPLRRLLWLEYFVAFLLAAILLRWGVFSRSGPQAWWLSAYAFILLTVAATGASVSVRVRVAEARASS
jgi:hypothetical protein